jgi:hypothetical protein
MYQPELKKDQNIVECLKTEELDPKYYMHEAEALMDELANGLNGFMDDNYAREKMRHLCEMFQYAYRNKDAKICEAMQDLKKVL